MRKLVAVTVAIMALTGAAQAQPSGTCLSTVAEQQGIVQVCEPDGTCHNELQTFWWVYTVQDGLGNKYYWGRADTQTKAEDAAQRHIDRNDFCTDR